MFLNAKLWKNNKIVWPHYLKPFLLNEMFGFKYLWDMDQKMLRESELAH